MQAVLLKYWKVRKASVCELVAQQRVEATTQVFLNNNGRKSVKKCEPDFVGAVHALLSYLTDVSLSTPARLLCSIERVALCRICEFPRLPLTGATSVAN